ncbi:MULTISPECIES: hypothetical protein [Bacillaceae]|uniref:Lipoprotein n=1 Tax=Peribacillus huizhouensis TaxID=1501239 RepID=A0ABR6CIW5_9BACI|nr:MULTISPECIES: hypothetical protein [Bacillaceae]MBA9024989.1 hypothetical protein [Peribacillus huizhouensis]
MRYFIVVFLIGSLLTGCGNKIPEPENVAMASTDNEISDPFSVHYFVKGNSIFVECYVKDYSFANHNQKQQTTVYVYMDDKKVKSVNTAAFIIKDVPVGPHKMRLVIHNKEKKVDLIKQFKVHISSTI